MAKAPPQDPIPEDIARMGFEDAMKELDSIVRSLEGGQVKLDEAVTKYTRGSLLKRHCEAKLADAKMKVEKITQAGKALGLEPMDEA
jgi:exodeoxyribonuclease VII small subunit